MSYCLPLHMRLVRRAQVWMEELDASDMRLITATSFPRLPADLLDRMIGFARALQRELPSRRFGSHGAPWDFNLRDLFRWCELMDLEQVHPPALFKPCSAVLLWREGMRVRVLFPQALY